jgi:hypothetical protein
MIRSTDFFSNSKKNLFLFRMCKVQSTLLVGACMLFPHMVFMQSTQVVQWARAICSTSTAAALANARVLFVECEHIEVFFVLLR